MRIFWVIASLGLLVVPLAAEVPAPTSPTILRLIEKMQGMDPYEAASELGYFIYQATRATSLDERLEAAEAGIWLGHHHPEWMQQKLTGYEGWFNSPAIAALFTLLTESVTAEEKQIFLPPLYPGLSRNAPNKDASPRDTAAVHYLKRRRELHSELCTLSLQQPIWAEHVLSHLSDAWLVDGKPTQEEMQNYAKKAVAACEERRTNVRSVSDLLDKWTSTSVERRYSEEQCARLLGIALPFGPVALRESRNPKDRPLGLVTCIQDETRRHPGQRCELMDELWRLACADEDPAVRRAVFPVWAAYRFDLSDDISSPLHHAGEFKTHASDPYLLRAVIATSHPPYGRFPLRLLQQLRLAAFVDDIVFEAPDLLKDEATADAVAEAANRLTLPPADAETTPLLQRASEAHARLLERLLGHTEASPDALFYMLRVKVMQGADTREIEKQLIAMVPKNPSLLEESLKRFIEEGNGTYKKREADQSEGYLGGCWELKRRNAWYAAALRIGRELSRLNTNRWIEKWLRAVEQGNRLAVPRVPGNSGYYVSRRPSGGYDPSQFPAADLLRARDDLLIAGQELALTLGKGYGDFGSYVALRLVRTPPEIEPVIQWLRQDPAKTGTRLSNMFDGYPDSMTGRLAAAEIAETFLKDWPADDAHTEWIKRLRPCLLRRSIPLIKGAHWEKEQAKASDLQHELPASQTQHATYLRLLHLAMQKPSFESQVFADFAQLHLSEEPELVLASCQRVIEQSPEKFYLGLCRVFKDHEALAPPSRRLEWVRLLMRLQPVMLKQTDTSNLQGWLLERLTTFCQAKNPEPENPIWLELSSKLSLFTSDMIAHTGFAPRLLNEYAAVQFASGVPGTSVLKQIKAACTKRTTSQKDDFEILSRQIWNWCTRLKQRGVTTKERLWAAEIMLGMSQFWPPDSSTSWLEHTSSLLASTAAKDPASLKTVIQLQLQLIDAARSEPYRFGGLLWYLGSTLAREGESLDEFKQQCLTMMRENLRNASESLERCWDCDHSTMANKPSGMRLVEAALHVLKQWPEDAPVESYAWTHALISSTGDQPSLWADREGMIGIKRQIIPPMPASSADCIAFQTAVLAELNRRQIQLPWMQALHLRLAWRSHVGLHDFFSPSRHKTTLDYLTEVFSFNLQNSNRNYPSKIQSAKFFAPHTNAQEVLEATRILHAAISQKLLERTFSHPLRLQASRCLKRIIELGQEVEKTCAGVPDGTWDGAIHPSQKNEAVELKKTLDALPD